MQVTVKFYPQAWVNDHAIDVDPEGETTFAVEASHLERFTEDALKYELEPYLELPQLPQWIREWRGPFWIDVERDDQAIVFIRHEPGAHAFQEWTARNERLAGDPTAEDAWRLTNDEGEDLGPFLTLDEARAYLHRYLTVDEWQEKVAAALEHMGHQDVADEFRAASEAYAMTYRDTHEDPEEAAKLLVVPRPFEAVIEETYTYRNRLQVQATCEAEALRVATQGYKPEPLDTFRAFAMGEIASRVNATEANELLPEEP